MPDAERKAGDGLDAALVELLAQIATRRNENHMIAARLAAKLGLPRVYATDNHTGDNVKDEFMVPSGPSAHPSRRNGC